MNVEWPTKICGCKEGEPTHVTPKIMPLVHYLKNNAQNILKLKIGCLSNGWTKKDVIVELEPKEVVKKMYQRVKCDCTKTQKPTLTLEHFLMCDAHGRERDEYKAVNGVHPFQVVEEAESSMEDADKDVRAKSRSLKKLSRFIATECIQKQVSLEPPISNPEDHNATQ